METQSLDALMLCSKCESAPKAVYSSGRRSSWCRACQSKAARDWNKANREKWRASKRKHYANNSEKLNKKRYEADLKNPEQKKARRLRWAQKNPEKVAESSKKRYEAFLRATPAWLTDKHKRQIAEIYFSRKKGFHVDHIVPLQSKNVCGLHVPWNLQILEESANFKKGNAQEEE